MKIAMTLTAATFALAVSAFSAQAQLHSGGGGTIGCDPSVPTWQVTATNCRIYHKEALYGPRANPYAAAWDRPVIVERRIVKTKKLRHHKSTTTIRSGY